MFEQIGVYIAAFFTSLGLFQVNGVPSKSVRPSFDSSVFITPPPDSLSFSIIQSSGSATIKERLATRSAELGLRNFVYQGEEIQTDATSSVRLILESFLGIDVGKDSDISFVQVLSDNCVVVQKKGIVRYMSTGIMPLSIRSYPVIVRIDTGNLEISIDPDTSNIRFTQMSGSSTLAYNDQTFTSRVRYVNAGETFDFDTSLRDQAQ